MAKKGLIETINHRDATTSGLVGLLKEGLQLDREATRTTDLQNRIRAVTVGSGPDALRNEVDPKRMVVVEAGDFKSN